MFLSIRSLKNTLLSLVFLILLGIYTPIFGQTQWESDIQVGAQLTEGYVPLLRDKKVGIIANQTSVIFHRKGYTHLVDSLLQLHIQISKVFSPEHGFRGQSDAGEHVSNQTDSKTGISIVSLYGKNRKPTSEQLDEVDVLLFDIQDVGVRFYTYIATLQLVMQAAAEHQIPLIVLDRPNPNGALIDGPTMLKENSSFLGMTPLPLAYGMTIGEYALLLADRPDWLGSNSTVQLTVIPLQNYTHQSTYTLPIKPSPNLPNAQAIALYPSLGLLEGTSLNAGRGSEVPFTRFGAPNLDASYYDFQYTPIPNAGAKHPKHQGKLCYGLDLSDVQIPQKIELKWLIEAYKHSTDPTGFFLTQGFTKHAGTPILQQQIEKGLSESQIRLSWQAGIDAFKRIRSNYLLYP